MIKIKKIDKKEINSLILVKEEFNKEYKISEKSRKFILREIEEYIKKGYALIAKIENEIVGYILGTIEKNRYENFGYIEEIFVLKKFRNRGISTQLKDNFIKTLKSKKIKIYRIEVNPNNQAKKIYEKWGFKIEKYRMGLKI